MSGGIENKLIKPKLYMHPIASVPRVLHELLPAKFPKALEPSTRALHIYRSPTYMRNKLWHSVRKSFEDWTKIPQDFFDKRVFPKLNEEFSAAMRCEAPGNFAIVSEIHKPSPPYAVRPPRIFPIINALFNNPGALPRELNFLGAASLLKISEKSVAHGQNDFYGSLGSQYDHPFMLKELHFHDGKTVHTLMENLEDYLDYDFSSMCESVGKMNIRENILLFVSALSALDAKHKGDPKRGLAPASHGDFKLENIFLIREGDPDNGPIKAKLADSEYSTSGKKVSEIKDHMKRLPGTDVYLPFFYNIDLSELDSSEHIDLDIFAVGITAYIVLTGDHFYESETEEPSFFSSPRANPLPNINLFSTIPKEIRDIVKCMLRVPASKPDGSKLTIEEVIKVFSRVYGIDLAQQTIDAHLGTDLYLNEPNRPYSF